MKYKTLLFDIDDTLLDFKAAEKYAFTKLLEKMDVEPSEDAILKYSEINLGLWEQFEKGQIERNILLGKRFEDFFNLYQKDVIGSEMDKEFRAALEEGHFLIDGSIKILDQLKHTHELYAVTNGVSKTQKRRLTDSGLLPYFKKVFVSEDTGFQKPMQEYFDYVFHRIPQFSLNDALIIGDSLTSDIKGGNIAGIDSCWFNPHKKPNPSSIEPTYQIEHLQDLHAILA
ncbi:YjjG family noncanonical pyrimidine nucleotidase [Jeotgalibaca ciconiae]|uniref:Noncanonical pyrimidine nucleotidase, YjjG family n=1 Tax=Jeotgalibaca ciconiae TaxID=2496265 RepID=A0A3Q9BL63_9LACT|nr:YjjG family noncanonical pyrimidine nucleotidase [Jeotgalibaca ciconiae]AZP04484.1 noncanonical pyrimidine nucleotidase, YjjG family [Jeotgalibaca ciconiae]